MYNQGKKGVKKNMKSFNKIASKIKILGPPGLGRGTPRGMPLAPPPLVRHRAYNVFDLAR